MNPLDPIVEVLVRRLDRNRQEAFEERAGILQFEANRPREVAEPLALLEVLRMHPLGLVQAQCHLVRWAGTPVYLLTSTTPPGSRVLSALGDPRATPVDLSLALGELGGSALLTPTKPITKNRGNRRI
jgi:hypothetical protein